MFEGGAAMKMIKPKLSPLQEENRTGYERLQNKLSRSPNEADLNKDATEQSSPRREALSNLTFNSKLSFNRGKQDILKLKHKITPLEEEL